MPSPKTMFTRVVVIQTAFLGDVVLITPFLRAIRERLDQAYLALVTTPQGAELLSGLKELDEIITYDKKGAQKGPGAFFSLVRKLQNKNFDLALCPHRSARTSLLVLLAGVPRRIGFRQSALSFLHTDRVERNPCLHEVERNLELLNPIGGIPPGFRPELYLPPPEPGLIRAFGLSADRLKIGLCPGSVWPTKRWTVEGFAALADLLSEKLGAEVYLLGAEADADIAKSVESLARRPLRNLSGRTQLKDLIAVISQMKALVANDSAPLHLATALGVPVVAIFGPTTPALGFGPYSNHSRVVEVDLSCRPCHPHGPRRCPEGHFRCMREIEPGQVFTAVEQLLSEIS
jgi:heptosyltransferase-2